MALSQAGTFTWVQFVEATHDADANALLVDIYFNLVDSNNRPLSEIDLDGARVTLDTGEIYEGEDQVSIGRPNTPFYVVMVLDASGSMAGANPAMRQAAVSAIDSAPAGAQFALLAFDDLVRDVQAFSPDLDAVRASINTVASTPGGGTCLYDGIYRALDLLERQGARRGAVMVFSDGVDERSDGTQPCSARTPDETIAKAQQLRVPLHIIGLVGANGSDAQIDSDLLNRFSTSTGGFFSSGAESQLDALFERAMRALSAQWQAQVRIYPRAGQHTASITPILEGGVQAQPETFTFSADRDYAKPFALFPETPSYDAQLGTITIPVRTEGGARAQSLYAEVIDANGLSIYRPTEPIILSSTSDQAPVMFTVPAQIISNNGEYTVRLNGLNGEDRLLPEDLLVTFTIDRRQPTIVAVQVKLTIVAVRLQPETIEVDFDALGRERIDRILLSLLDANNAEIAAIETPGTERTASFPRTALEPGENYTITARPYDASGRPLLDQAADRSFTNGPPPETPRLIIAISHTLGTTGVTVDLESSNTSEIATIEVSVINAETNTRVGTPFTLEGVPPDFPITPELISQLGAGEYIVRLTPKKRSGELLFPQPLESDPFVYAPPTPGFIQVVGSVVTNPIMLALVVAAIGVLSLNLVSRRGKAKKTPAWKQGYNYGVTNAVSAVADDRPVQRAGETAIADAAYDAPAGKPVETRIYTSKQPINDDTLTERPLAELMVMRSRSFREGHSWTLTSRRTVLGRGGGGTINFDKDEEVSSVHLELQYDREKSVFFATDLGREGRGTANGSRINDTLIKNNRVALPTSGETIIRLGNVKLALRMYRIER